MGYIGYMIEEFCHAKLTLILKRTKNRMSDIILNRLQPHAYPQTDKKQDISKKLQFCYNFVKTFLRGCFIIERY